MAERRGHRYGAAVVGWAEKAGVIRLAACPLDGDIVVSAAGGAATGSDDASLGARTMKSASVDRSAATDASSDDIRQGVDALMSDIAGAKELQIALVAPAGMMMHRPTSLPDADAQTTEQMVQLQLESWMPGQAERFTPGWSRGSGDGIGWIVLAGQRLVDRAKQLELQAADDMVGVALVSIETSLAAWVMSHVKPAAPVLAIHVEQRHTTLALTDAHGLIGASSFDAGAESWQAEGDDTAGRDAWVIMLTDAVRRMTAGEDESPAPKLTPTSSSTRTPTRTPTQVVWFGELLPAGMTGGVLDLPRVNRTGGLGRRDAADLRDAAALAEGAALSLRVDALPHIWVSGNPRRQVKQRTIPKWAYAVAGIWLVGACGAMIAMDIQAAAALQQKVDENPALTARTDTLDRDLALARHLEAKGPTPFAVVEELIRITSKFAPKEMHFDADGRIEMRGQAGSPEEVSKLLVELSAGKTIEAVQLRSQRMANNKLEYDILIQTARPFFDAVVTPPDVKSDGDQSKGKDKKKGAGS